MNGEQIAGIIRAVIAAVGGYFVGKGVIDAETVSAIAGAFTTIIVAAWSVLAKRKGVPVNPQA